MALSRVDELNNLQSEINRLGIARKIREYFESMLLSEESIAIRIRLATRFEEITRAMYEYAEELKKSDDEGIEDTLLAFYGDKIFEVIGQFDLNVDENIVNKFAEMIVNTTLTHDGDFFSSDVRAFQNAVDLANILENNSEFKEALEQGKLYKIWHTALDERVRETHQMVESEMVPVFGVFKVGGYPMLYPGDFSLGASASEIVNCRCTVEYI